MPLFPYNPRQLLAAYMQGKFPTLGDQGEFILFSPATRAVIPIDGLHISKTLTQTLRKGTFEVRFDQDFLEIVQGCVRDEQEDNWITAEVIRVYQAIHKQGWGHCVGCYADGKLVGGVYGVAIGACFFIESMFSRKSDASKVALKHLFDRLRGQGFRIVDVQLMSPHLESMGAVAISDQEFRKHLENTIEINTGWGQNSHQLVMSVFPPYLTGERVVIRSLLISDCDELALIHADPEFSNFTFVPRLQNRHHAQRYIQEAFAKGYPHGRPDPLAISLRTAPENLIGTIGAFAPITGLPQMEFAYDISRKHWNQGYATEAAALFRDFLFAHYPVHRLQARCAPQNPASARVLEKLGFQKEGRLRDVMYFNDQLWDLDYYSMTYRDWTEDHSAIGRVRNPEDSLSSQHSQ